MQAIKSIFAAQSIFQSFKVVSRICVFLSLVAPLFLSGCTTTPRKPKYTVSVNGFAAPMTNSAISFIVLPGEKGVEASDLQFQEYSTFLERALSQRGFRRVSSIEDADIAVFLAYGIGEPKEHVYSYSIPHFGQTGVSSSTTYGSFYGNSYSGTTYYNPTYGVTGYSSHVGTYTTFTRHILIEAVDMAAYRSQNKTMQLWKTVIVSIGSSGDLRRVFPVMIGAAAAYLSTSTGEVRTVDIYEDDPRVLLVKGVQLEQKK